MPYSILLVEDEGAASRYLRSIIELKCPDFSVVAVAEDGHAGLAAARVRRPDLVITDIRMPGMDGLEFARALKRELPNVPAVIVSGYQEFEYARAALGTGVVEYLLKPVSAGGLAAALEALRPRLEENAACEKKAALEALLAGAGGPATAVAATTKAAATEVAGSTWWVALFREGGLPSRFTREAAPAAEMGGRPEAAFFVLNGRDGRERFFLAPRDAMDLDSFSRRVRAETGFAEAAGTPRATACRTLIFAPRDLAGEDLAEGARELRRTVDRTIVLGEARIAYGSTAATKTSDWDPVLSDRVEFCLANSRFDDLEQAVRGAVDAWRAERRPHFRTEAALRKLLHFVQRKALGPGDPDEDLEYFLDAGMTGSADWDALADAAWALTRRAAGIAGAEAVPSGGAKADAPAFFGAILRHVDEHYGRPLSLGSISEAFRISETYLSKLFRKHMDKSFGEYLTFRRIEAAKRLMAESPDMPLKDVASCVGFQDPFYFSRVFKAVTGLPPSEYR